MKFNLKFALGLIFIVLLIWTALFSHFQSSEKEEARRMKESLISGKFLDFGSVRSAIKCKNFPHKFRSLLDPQGQHKVIPGGFGDSGGFNLAKPNRTAVIDYSYHFYLPTPSSNSLFVKIRIYSSFQEKDIQAEHFASNSELTIFYGKSALSKQAASLVAKELNGFGMKIVQKPFEKSITVAQ